MTGDRPSVLLLLHGLGLGGAEWSVVHLARGLRDLGVPAVVYAWKRAGPLADVLRQSSLEVHVPSQSPEGLARLAALGRVASLARRHDLVHAHLSDAAVLGVWAQALVGRPCVVTHHSPDLVDGVGRPGSLYRFLRRRLLVLCARRASLNIAVSEDVRRELCAAARVDAARVPIARNAVAVPADEAVDAARERRHARAAAGAPLRAVFVGRLVPGKDVATLLDAAALLDPGCARLELLVVGHGPQAGNLERRAHELGIADRVRLVGSSLEVAAYLADADMLVSPSRLEGEPLAVLEAQAWGLPVVASDIPGHRRLVESGPSGWLVAPGDPGALARTLESVCREPAAREARGAAGRARVAAAHAPSAVARAHLELYRSVLNARRGPTARLGSS